MKSIIIFALCLYPISTSAQTKHDAFNNSRQKSGGGINSAFNQIRINNFNDYRQKLNAEYISKTREKWKSFNSFRGLAFPDRDIKPVTPIKMSEEDARRNKQDNQLMIGETVKPIPNNDTPSPIAPIQEIPENNPQFFSFSYLGTSLKIRKPQGGSFRLSGTSENAIADAWEKLCDQRFNNMIVDCIK